MKIIYLLLLAANLLLQSCAGVVNFMDPQGPVYSGSYAKWQLADSRIIKVVSYNIAWAAKVDLAMEELRRFPRLRGADIVLLQEMDAASVDRMARKLGYNYIYHPGSVHNVHDKDIGNAILSKWELSDGKKIIFPHKQSWNDRIRTATVATVDVHGRKIRTYNVHAATVLMSAGKQLEQLESVLDDVTGAYDYVVVGGDFNTARPGSIRRVKELFTRAGFKRASEKAGCTAWALGVLPFTLDHIYIRGLEVLECGTINSAEASDHLPLWTTLRFQQTTLPFATRQVDH
ncbi:endonuclease/exonuclease/phosphatase family protein [candidate division KSB1 bacterium]|nr:endonuclease/exonuclease/phosphatase family protein [candidate division KSB1 bacterium]